MLLESNKQAFHVTVTRNETDHHFLYIYNRNEAPNAIIWKISCAITAHCVDGLLNPITGGEMLGVFTNEILGRKN